MQRIYLTLIALLLPALAHAASSNATIIIGEDSARPTASVASVPGAGFANFPENAITRVGENTTGQHVDAPTAPPSPASPASPAPAAAPKSPENPASPTPPASPASKLWPRNSIELFMPSCTGLRPQYVKPCACVITRLMVAMPHDEFLKKSEDGTIEQDDRLKNIRNDCATAPARKD